MGTAWGHGTWPTLLLGITHRWHRGARSGRRPTLSLGIDTLGQVLGKRRPLAQHRALPVDDVDCDDKQERDAKEDDGRVEQWLSVLAWDVFVEWGGRAGEHTGKEIASPAVATSGGGRVRPVSANHVIDCGHVDCIVSNSDDGTCKHGADPVNWGPIASEGEDEETKREARREVEKPPKAGLVLCMLVIRPCPSLCRVALDCRDEGQPCNDITDSDGDEGQANVVVVEIPLRVDETEGLDLHENESICEARQERQDQDDGLGKEHGEWTNPGVDELAPCKALTEWLDFVGAPDVLAILPALLGDVVDHDSGAGLGDSDQVQDLDKGTEDELDPDAPPPRQELLDESADNGPQNRATDGGKDDVGDGILLVVRVKHVGNHAEGHAATGRGETAETPADNDTSEVGGQSDRQSPDVDKEERGLHYGFATELLGPRSPELAAKGVEDEEQGGTETGDLLADLELLGDASQAIGVEGSVEVHGRLNQEDDGQNPPLLELWVGECQLALALLGSKLPLGAGSSRAAVIVVGRRMVVALLVYDGRLGAGGCFLLSIDVPSLRGRLCRGGRHGACVCCARRRGGEDGVGYISNY